MSDSASNNENTQPAQLPDSGADDTDPDTSNGSSSADGSPDTRKPAGPPGTKKADGPSGTTKPAGPPDSKKPAGPPGGKKPAGPGGKLPPGFKKKSRKKAPEKSDVEVHKEGSEYLREGVEEKLESDVDHFDPDQKEVIKHHGLYQQDDRDLRKKIDGKHYYFFVRSKIPGGKLTADQYLVHDDLADEYGIGSIRVTTRQGIQIHGVYKDDLKDHIQALNEKMVTTLGACGDIVRNTMCCPAPTDDPLRREIQELAEKVARYTTPQSPAYHDIWLKSYDEDEQEVETLEKLYHGKENVDEIEPLYGKSYLPRKFKIGFAYPGDNCVDVYTHDIGLIAIADGEELAGFNILVGGGLGNTHNKPKTYPRLGDVLGYIPKEETIDLVHHIISIQRDHGDRKDRKQARMKYLVDDWGLEKFHSELADRLGYRLDDPAPMPELDLDLHLGWQEQGSGQYYYGVSVENGRIVDTDELKLKSALREAVETLRPGVRLTPNHNVLLTDLSAGDRQELESILQKHGVVLPEDKTNLEKYSIACPALPTCGLALTESERIFPDMIDQLEETVDELGIDDEKISIRMTGCPNGCARPYVSDVGIVGQTLDKYKIYLGGRSDGTRLNEPYAELVDIDEVVPMVKSLLRTYKDERTNEETFGDFCDRVGANELQTLVEH